MESYGQGPTASIASLIEVAGVCLQGGGIIQLEVGAELIFQSCQICTPLPRHLVAYVQPDRLDGILFGTGGGQKDERLAF